MLSKYYIKQVLNRKIFSAASPKNIGSAAPVINHSLQQYNSFWITLFQGLYVEWGYFKQGPPVQQNPKTSDLSDFTFSCNSFMP